MQHLMNYTEKLVESGRFPGGSGANPWSVWFTVQGANYFSLPTGHRQKVKSCVTGPVKKWAQALWHFSIRLRA